jgi:hypothetical protein
LAVGVDQVSDDLGPLVDKVRPPAQEITSAGRADGSRSATLICGPPPYLLNVRNGTLSPWLLGIQSREP